MLSVAAATGGRSHPDGPLRWVRKHRPQLPPPPLPPHILFERLWCPASCHVVISACLFFRLPPDWRGAVRERGAETCAGFLKLPTGTGQPCIQLNQTPFWCVPPKLLTCLPFPSNSSPSASGLPTRHKQYFGSQRAARSGLSNPRAMSHNIPLCVRGRCCEHNSYYEYNS